MCVCVCYTRQDVDVLFYQLYVSYAIIWVLFISDLSGRVAWMIVSLTTSLGENAERTGYMDFNSLFIHRY